MNQKPSQPRFPSGPETDGQPPGHRRKRLGFIAIGKGSMTTGIASTTAGSALEAKRIAPVAKGIDFVANGKAYATKTMAAVPNGNDGVPAGIARVSDGIDPVPNGMT